jgi:hypothetical protein
MRQPPIIIIINKKPYTVSATDIESIRNMPGADRQQLITLLEAIKQQEIPVQVVSQQTVTGVNAFPLSAPTGNTSSFQPISAQRLGSGDVDAVMAQLIMEEKLNKKPELTKQSIQKWTVIIAFIILLLVIVL